MLFRSGASGLLCAVMLARKGVQVTVLEKNHRIGKKLSATGNGRCNFTNLHMNENCYYGNSKFISHLLTEVSAKCVIAEFEKYGILHREKDGYVYPHTNQAATVVNDRSYICNVGTSIHLKKISFTSNNDIWGKKHIHA